MVSSLPCWVVVLKLHSSALIELAKQIKKEQEKKIVNFVKKYISNEILILLNYFYSIKIGIAMISQGGAQQCEDLFYLLSGAAPRGDLAKRQKVQRFRSG